MKYVLIFFLASNSHIPINHEPYTQYATKDECERDGKIMTIELRDNPPWSYECRAKSSP